MINIDGKDYVRPQVIGKITIEGPTGGQLADFSIGVIVADSPMGAPYNAELWSQDGNEELNAEQLFNAYTNKDALIRDYGDGDIYTMFKYAQKVGAGAQFVLNARPNTQARAALDDASDDALWMKARKHLFGAGGNWISRSISESDSDVILDSGTATGGSSSTLVDSAQTWPDDSLNDKWVVITAGTGAGQARKITDTVESTDTITVSPNWTVNPSTDSEYNIVEPKFTYTFTPPKYVKMLGANAASGADFLYLKGIEGLYPGQTLTIASNAGTTESITISSISRKYTANGYKVVLASALANAYTTANYGLIFTQDLARTEVFEFAGDTNSLENIQATINDRNIFLEVEIDDDATGPPIAVAEAYLGNVSGATRGTSPASSAATFIEVASKLQTWMQEFINSNGVAFRVFCIGSSDSAVHAAWRDEAVVMRKTAQKPIQVVVGTALGDVQTTGSVNTNPGYRAKNLNSDEIQLCAIGLDGLPAYLTFAAEMYGIRISNPVTHNATRDIIVSDSLEKVLSPLEMDALIGAGVTIPGVNKRGKYVAFMITTYQDQSRQWNVEDQKTYLVSQRDKADFVFVSLADFLDEIGVGTDSTREEITASVDTFMEQNVQVGGFVTSYSIEMEARPGAVVNKVKINLPDQIDFAVLNLAIQQGVLGS